MSVVNLVIVGLLLITSLASILVYIRQQRTAPDAAEMAGLKAKLAQNEIQLAELEKLREERSALREARASLEARLMAEQKASAEREHVLKDSEQRLSDQFTLLANRILSETGESLQKSSETQLGHLITPLREQLQDFRARVDAVNQASTDRTSSLITLVRELQDKTNTVSQEANQLAQAIRGNAKQQGDWGELIVERILEASGLQKGIEYEAQSSIRMDEGNLVRPDFMVHLPGSKEVILDSKVSLTAYERWASSAEDAVRQQALQEHLKSVRAHVKELQDKDYSQLMGNRSLDFVVMCIPLEPAYQLAMQEDRSLMYDLAASNVVITGPATLMITLKLIAQLWRREKENQNAAVIADKAGKLYDHILRIEESMSRARSQLETVTRSMDEAYNRLTDGRGNAIKRINELKQLGAKVSKTLPASLEGSLDEDEQDAVDEDK